MYGLHWGKTDLPKNPSHGSIFPSTEHYQKRIFGYGVKTFYNQKQIVKWGNQSLE